jgi:hypothetical protein
MAFLSQAGDSLMRTLIALSFVAALFAVSFAGPVSAGMGCDGYKTLSVENETHDQSVAESDGPQSTKPAD